jgi:hypothetical protein
VFDGGNIDFARFFGPVGTGVGTLRFGSGNDAGWGITTPRKKQSQLPPAALSSHLTRALNTSAPSRAHFPSVSPGLAMRRGHGGGNGRREHTSLIGLSPAQMKRRRQQVCRVMSAEQPLSAERVPESHFFILQLFHFASTRHSSNYTLWG